MADLNWKSMTLVDDGEITPGTNGWVGDVGVGNGLTAHADLFLNIGSGVYTAIFRLLRANGTPTVGQAAENTNRTAALDQALAKWNQIVKVNGTGRTGVTPQEKAAAVSLASQ